MNTTAQIQQYIQEIPRGKLFASTTLLKCGARASVDKALSRLTGAGKIVRVTRGIYVRPKENRFIGNILPEPFKVAEEIAKKSHASIQINGAEAARQFGFTTQVPVKPLFYTTGQSRKFKIGNLEVNLKHISPRKLPAQLSESKVGLAILALWYLGKQAMTIQAIKIIENKLTSTEFEQFISSKEFMPGWMSNIVFEYEKENKDA